MSEKARCLATAAGANRQCERFAKHPAQGDAPGIATRCYAHKVAAQHPNAIATWKVGAHIPINIGSDSSRNNTSGIYLSHCAVSSRV